jgi:hypothetical protein
MPLGITIICISLNHEYDARLHKDVFITIDIIVLHMQCDVDAYYYIIPSYWVLYWGRNRKQRLADR